MNPKYEKILYMKRPESHFAKMSREARAGQFASFAALSGHEEAILYIRLLWLTRRSMGRICNLGLFLYLWENFMI